MVLYDQRDIGQNLTVVIVFITPCVAKPAIKKIACFAISWGIIFAPVIKCRIF